ncbi:BatA domain-containing protein [Stenotrophomonas sp. PS02298]|uniref:BatA domain-containing protein n=1 Tax=Stenotrophomonas sp. PS02298 TaxID=2991424 RepID=UPI00249AB1CC|nr:BatA domain-containing protein [Stenotrophomonas sp. PS02298]
MSLLWLFPAGFLALTALLLPLLIHLARRSEQRIIDFAALRWLSAKPRPRRRIRFDEWPLLVLRLLLLALLAVLLARPALTGMPDTQPRIAVVPGVDLAAAQRSAGNADAQWLWLAAGFPSIDNTAIPRGPQPLSSLLRELDASLPADAPLTVVVPSVLDGLDAQRPQLSRAVRWQVLEQDAAATKPIAVAAPELQIRHDEAGKQGMRYLNAVASAWRGTKPETADDTVAFSNDNKLHVWLTAKPLPADTSAWLQRGGRLLVDARTPIPADAQRAPLWRDANGVLVIEQISTPQGQWLRWAAPLQPASLPVLLDADFPNDLRAVLQAVPTPRRALAATMQPNTGATPYAQPATELGHWLLLAIALLFLFERWWASAPRRRGQV